MSRNPSNSSLDNLLDNKDYELILALLEDPLIPYADLAKKLSYFKSPTTIKNRIERLLNLKIIYGFRIMPNLPKLGLTTHIICIEPTSQRNLRYLEKFCDIHPYTRFRARCTGGINGLFIQFSVPDGCFPYLEEIVIRLQKESRITNRMYIQEVRWRKNTHSFLEKWFFEGQVKGVSNGVDISKWFNHIDKFSKIVRGKSKPLKQIIKKLSIVDLFILHQLNKDARVKQSVILEALAANKELHNIFEIKVDEINDSPRKIQISWFEGFLNEENSKKRSIEVDKYLISERYQFLKRQGILSDKRIAYDLNKLHLFSALVFCGKMEKDRLSQFFNALSDLRDPFPCFSRFMVTPKFNSFSWYVELEPAALNAVNDWFQDNCSEFMSLILSIAKSTSYPLWFKNFNLETLSWRNSSDWIVEKPFDYLNKLELVS